MFDASAFVDEVYVTNGLLQLNGVGQLVDEVLDPSPDKKSSDATGVTAGGLAFFLFGTSCLFKKGG